MDKRLSLAAAAAIHRADVLQSCIRDYCASLNRHPASVSNLLHAIATLLIFQLVGEVLVRRAALPVLGSVLGLILLLLVFALCGAVPEALHTVS